MRASLFDQSVELSDNRADLLLGLLVALLGAEPGRVENGVDLPGFALVVLFGFLLLVIALITEAALEVVVADTSFGDAIVGLDDGAAAERSVFLLGAFLVGVVALGDALLRIAKVLHGLSAALVVISLAAELGLLALGGEAVEFGHEFAFGLDGKGAHEFGVRSAEFGVLIGRPT